METAPAAANPSSGLGLVLVARGRSDEEIARELLVGETTVKTHVNRVLAELGLTGRVQAVVLAHETGLVTPGG